VAVTSKGSGWNVEGTVINTEVVVGITTVVGVTVEVKTVVLSPTLVLRNVVACVPVWLKNPVEERTEVTLKTLALINTVPSIVEVWLETITLVDTAIVVVTGGVLKNVVVITSLHPKGTIDGPAGKHDDRPGYWEEYCLLLIKKSRTVCGT
jgi:hypothetical protein